jgi:hypothetical protein
MREKKVIVRVLETFRFRIPLSRKLRRLVLAAKKRTYIMIIKTERGETTPDLSEEVLYKTETVSILERINNAKYVIAGAAAVILIALTLLFTIRDKSGNQIALTDGIRAQAVFVAGDVSFSRKGTPVHPGDAVAQNDLIRTGPISSVSIQIHGIGVVKVLENTEFSFESLGKNDMTSIALAHGGIFSNVNKLSKNSIYQIKTPDTVARVRGTQFLVTADKTGSEVQVLDGKVSVEMNNTGTPEEKIISGGEGIIIAHDHHAGKQYQLNKVQTLILQKYSLYDYINKLDEKKPDEMKTLHDGIIIREREIDTMIAKLTASADKKINPLDKLRRQGKPLTMLHLRDGSQIAGSVVSSTDDAIKIDTGDGIIDVPIKDILRRVMMR